MFLGHSAKSSPSARRKTLGKIAFADKPVAECRLPSVTLGKRFAECFGGFDECPWHSAKLLYSVVMCKKVEIDMDICVVSGVWKNCSPFSREKC